MKIRLDESLLAVIYMLSSFKNEWTTLSWLFFHNIKETENCTNYSIKSQAMCLVNVVCSDFKCPWQPAAGSAKVEEILGGTEFNSDPLVWKMEGRVTGRCAWGHRVKLERAAVTARRCVQMGRQIRLGASIGTCDSSLCVSTWLGHRVHRHLAKCYSGCIHLSDVSGWD